MRRIRWYLERKCTRLLNAEKEVVGLILLIKIPLGYIIFMIFILD